MRVEYWVLCDGCGHNGDYGPKLVQARRDATQHANEHGHVVMIYKKDLTLIRSIAPSKDVAQTRMF